MTQGVTDALTVIVILKIVPVVSQLRDCCTELVYLAKASGTAVCLVGHVTKEGPLAGPKLVEHIVDTVLYFEGDTHSSFRLIRAVKNRFGAVNELGMIAGQKPVVTKARLSIAAFKLRENMPIGCMVTLRGVTMFEFLDRFVTVSLPRVRDFRGISGRSFDGRGNYNIGVKEQIIFPEIEYDKVDALRGLNISITTTAKTDDEAKALLAAFKFPFKN